MFAWQELIFFIFFFVVFFKYFCITWNVQNRSWQARLPPLLPLLQLGNLSMKIDIVFFFCLFFTFCEVRRHIIEKRTVFGTGYETGNDQQTMLSLPSLSFSPFFLLALSITSASLRFDIVFCIYLQF